MADTARVIEPLTPDEYLDRERLAPIRHEYVDGVIYAMAGATERHNIIAVLTEAASVRMASPTFLPEEELKGSTRGFSDHKLAVNFADPWPGGWWHLRDIVEYEKICARSLLTLAARYREAGLWENLTVTAMVARTARRIPNKTAIIAGDRHINFCRRRGTKCVCT